MNDQDQAGIGGPGGALIDQHGRFIYYAIHVNPAFLSFLRAHNLTTLDGINKIDQTLTFPTGVMELKSAWMLVKNRKEALNYFVIPAKIQRFVVSNGVLTPQKDNKGQPVFDNVTAALLAIHVVFTLPGHPEMIWSTFEHVHEDSGKVVRDNAPAAASNPSKTAPNGVISSQTFPLYKAGTVAADANKPILDQSVLAQHWDSTSQSFTQGGSILQTSVYRPYPGSKTDKDPVEDNEVTQINDNVTRLFKEARAKGLINSSDMRQNYRLVGAVWLNDPLLPPAPSFTKGQSFVNPIDQSTDDDAAALAGEGRLGSTAMESFTEFEDAAPNCFSCHDTNAVRHNRVLLPAGTLNVSHVLSKFKDSQP